MCFFKRGINISIFCIRISVEMACDVSELEMFFACQHGVIMYFLRLANYDLDVVENY